MLSGARNSWIATALALAAFFAAALACAAGSPYVAPAEIFGVAAILYIIGGRVRSSPARDLPFPRGKFAGAALVGAFAIVATARTLTLPYLADDYCLLNDRGLTESWTEALFDVSTGTMWFRPVYWLFWKLYHNLSPESGTLAHACSIAMFAIHCMLLAPALRKCGVKRGISHAAAILFALSPAALDTVAWATNQGLLLVGIFSCASILAIPTRGRNVVRTASSVVFAIFAYLSKEEAFVLPAIGFIVCWRFRRDRVSMALKSASPILAAAIILFIVRWIRLGGIGAYSNAATGGSLLLENALKGPIAALRNEFPQAYWLPMRYPPQGAIAAASLILLPAIPFVWARGSRGVERILYIAAAFFIIYISPVSSMLPIGPHLEYSRWLYLPTIGIALASAALYANGPLRRRSAWIPILCFGALSAFVANYDLRAWKKSAELTNTGKEMIRAAMPSPPPNAHYWFIGLPDSIDGVQCFNCGMDPLARRAIGRTDVEFYDDPPIDKTLSDIIIFNIRKKEWRSALAAKRSELAKGGRVEWKIRDNPDVNHYNCIKSPFSDAECGFANSAEKVTTEIMAFGPGMGRGAVFFPALDARVLKKIKIETDLSKSPLAAFAPVPGVVVVLAGGVHGIIQINAKDGDVVALPPGVDYIILSIRIGPGAFQFASRMAVVAVE
ncbi:MAG: hypothetical protein HY286_09070 [Planctomycetes bacterium]|nr:hypothetical protein [Planctomycetota bacterium]